MEFIKMSIVRSKIPQMPQDLSAQFVCSSPKVLDFSEKRLHWASILRDKTYSDETNNFLCVLGTQLLKKGSALLAR